MLRRDNFFWPHSVKQGKERNYQLPTGPWAHVTTDTGQTNDDDDAGDVAVNERMVTRDYTRDNNNGTTNCFSSSISSRLLLSDKT